MESEFLHVTQSDQVCIHLRTSRDWRKWSREQEGAQLGRWTLFPFHLWPNLSEPIKRVSMLNNIKKKIGTLSSLALKYSKFGVFHMMFFFDCPALIIIYWITFSNFHLSTLCASFFVHYLNSSEIITYCAERKWQFELARAMNINSKNKKLSKSFEKSGTWKLNKDFSVT